MISYAIDFLKVKNLDEETTEDGKVVKTTYGIERIPDPSCCLKKCKLIEKELTWIDLYHLLL